MTCADHNRMANIIDRALDGDCGHGIGKHLADAIIADATITTLEELEALPLGSIVRHDGHLVVYEDGSWERGGIAEKREDASGQTAWFFVGRELGYRSHQADLLPALLVYLGGPS